MSKLKDMRLINVSGIHVFGGINKYLMDPALPIDHYYVPVKAYRRDGNSLIKMKVAEGSTDIEKLENTQAAIRDFIDRNIDKIPSVISKKIAEKGRDFVHKMFEIPLIVYVSAVSDTNERCFEIEICDKIFIVVS